MLLHADREGDGPPIVLVHGFTQTRRCWGPEAADLARDHTVIRVDAPGHGRSAEIVASLRKDGVDLGAAGASSEAIAIIAYLQRLGRDIRWREQPIGTASLGPAR